MTVTNNSAKIIKYVTSAESIIKGKRAVCRQKDGAEPVIKGLSGTVKSPEFLNLITDKPNVTAHIDILSDDFTLQYSLSDKVVLVETVALLGFDGGSEYSIRDFGIYLSDDDEVFKPENLVYSYSCKTEFVPGTRSNCDVMVTFGKPVPAKMLGLRFPKPNPTDDIARIAFIGVYGENGANEKRESTERLYEVTVMDNVLCEDFHGIGACVLPMNFMDRSLAEGFNAAYWEKEKSRVNMCRPAVVRLWFQPDWFITDKDAYYRHEYDFNSENMHAVYPYLDLYKECGIEVEFNFGWKVAAENQSWFSIPDVRAKDSSAPADLDEFAFSCAECMYELIVNRGYTNIKYLSFYNEPCTRDTNSEWIGDFLVIPPLGSVTEPGELAREKFSYWLEMAHKVKRQLNKKGLSDKLSIWGAECAGDDKTLAAWLKGFGNEENPAIDVYTIHTYHTNDEEIGKMSRELKKAGNIPVCATEFATSAIGRLWDLSNIQMVMSFIANGFCGALIWILSGTTLPSPATFSIDGEDENMWRRLTAKPNGVNPIFYELCLFMRYIPAHSKSLAVKLPDFGTERHFNPYELKWQDYAESSIRAAAFMTPSGEYAVFVETKESTESKSLKLNLLCKEKLVFNKFTVDCKFDISKPARLPACAGTVTAENGILTDDLGAGYSLTLYTTAKPCGQIVCSEDIIELAPGEKHKIEYSLLDTADGDVTLEIADGNDIVTLENGFVTVNENARKGNIAAVKIALTGNESVYDTVLVKVI